MSNVEELELILHNVEQGLAVSFIEYPSKYVTHIDLGASENYSPLVYLSNKYNVCPDIIYITHPHPDHLYEVERLFHLLSSYDNYDNIVLHYQVYDWDDVIRRERTNKRSLINMFLKIIEKAKYGYYIGGCELNSWRYTPDKAKRNFGEASYINNSSIHIVFKWGVFKIYIGGDLETDAIEKSVSENEFSSSAKGTLLYIAPHHGHQNGFSYDWPRKIGKPYLNLIPAQARDPNLAPGYSSSMCAKGWDFGGQKKYMLSTRNDGTIHVNMWFRDNEPVWSFNFDR